MTQNPPVAGASDTRDGPLSETAVFDILSNKRRRECIALLMQRSDDDAVSAWSISHAVAAALSEDDSPSRKFQHSVYVSLIQTHLPTLDDHDVVEFAEADKSISPGENLSVLEPFLDIPGSEEASSEDRGDGGNSADGEGNASDSRPPSARSSGAAEGSSSASSSAVPYVVTPASASPVVRAGYLLASVAAVVLLLVAVREPATVTDGVRVAVVVLHLFAIGLIVVSGLPSVTTPFFE